MREKWAKIIAFFTGLLVILLSVLFALTQNPAQPIVSTQIQTQDFPAGQNKQIAAGRHVYQQQGCARCHAIAGKGNPRIPLDGVGKKHDAKEMHDWITGSDRLQDALPAYALRTKQAYKKLPEKDMDVLVIYMQSL